MEQLVLLEGLHAVKHVQRFGGRLLRVVTDDWDKALNAAAQVDSEMIPWLAEHLERVPREQFRAWASQPVPTHVIGWADRPIHVLADLRPHPGQPAVLLDDPRNSKNLGAVIRVAAGVGASGVMVNGDVDPCSVMAIRGAAGLQWALPTYAAGHLLRELGDWGIGKWGDPVGLASSSLREGSGSDVVDRKVEDGGQATRSAIPDQDSARPVLIALDADGATFHPEEYVGQSVIFAFGSERVGLSAAVRQMADRIVSLPMMAGVSSLNLATCVSAVLYLQRYAEER
ncbi:MAG: hypothetical protein LBV30_09405 [Propionibacteriaceae bacterium]|jgi:TrmH family RNA methyltransferase|nr:hypothetical protein [Propionibacteriaceae bacterium]